MRLELESELEAHAYVSMRQIRKWEVDAMCLRLLASVVLSSAVPRKQRTSVRVGWAKVKKQGLKSGCACQGH